MKLGEGVHHLSPREKRLLRRLAQRKTDERIAQEMSGPAHKIAAQRQKIIEKLQITSRAQLIALADLVAWPRWKDAKSNSARHNTWTAHVSIGR